MSPLERLKWLDSINKSSASSAVLSVAINLAWRANTNGECYPSQKRIAEDSNLKVNSIYRAVKQLKEMSFLEVKTNSVGIRADRMSNLYTLIPQPDETAVETGRTNIRGVCTAVHKPDQEQPKQIRERKENIIQDSVKRLIQSYQAIRKDGANTKQTDTNIKKRLKTHTVEELLTTVNNYRKVVENESRETRYRMKATNFFGQKAGYEEYLPANFDSSQTSNTPTLDDEDNFTYSEEQIAEIMELEETIAKEAQKDMEKQHCQDTTSNPSMN